MESIESPRKFNFRKKKDRKAFERLGEFDKEYEALRALDEATLINEWMKKDKQDKRLKEKIPTYLGKLKNAKKLYRHDDMYKIGWRLDLEMPEFTSEYINYANVEKPKDTEQNTKAQSILTKIKSAYLKKEDILAAVKGTIHTLIALGDYDTAAKLAKLGLENGREWKASILRLKDIKEREDERREKRETAGERGLERSLSKKILFQAQTILKIKKAIEENPDIPTLELQKLLRKELERFSGSRTVKEFMEKNLTSRLDEFHLRRKRINDFRNQFEKQKEKIKRVIGFDPSEEVQIIYCPWAITIVLGAEDHKKFLSQRAKYPFRLGTHFEGNEFNVVSTNQRSIIYHEELHSFENLFTDTDLDTEKYLKLVLDSIGEKTDFERTKKLLHALLSNQLLMIKNEILNDYHEDDWAKKEGVPYVADWRNLDIEDEITAVLVRLRKNYLPECMKEYSQIEEKLKLHPNKEISNVIKMYQDALEGLMQGGAVFYEKALQNVREKKGGMEKEETCFIAGMLLPLARFNLMPRIVKNILEE